MEPLHAIKFSVTGDVRFPRSLWIHSPESAQLLNKKLMFFPFPLSRMSGPSAQYKKRDYWDSRYESEVAYDWLLKYDALKPHLEPLLREEDRILILG
jgi:hypothetical protein